MFGMSIVVVCSNSLKNKDEGPEFRATTAKLLRPLLFVLEDGE